MKQQFNFETNIEKRMPDTGNVFMVDRMTSDYALFHPFNVDEFIEEVCEHWNGTESRETIRQYFNYGLGRKGEKFSTHCPAKHRDKEVKDPKTGIGQIEFGKWPEHVGGLRPSLIEAWNKGAEYHTKGFRQGDVLPTIVPSCKITRLDNGEWIALFPKDMMLLDAASEECRVKNEEFAAAAGSSKIVPQEESVPLQVETAEQNDAPVSLVAVAASDDAPAEEKSVQSVVEEQEPVQLDLFAQMQMQIDQLRQENDRICNMIQEQAAFCSPRNEEDCSCVRQEQPRRAARRNRQPLDVSTLYGARPSRTAQAAAAYPRFYNSSETSLTAESKHGHEWLKAVGLAAATVLALIVTFKTGLLIPLGLIGLGASGLLK